MIFSVLMSVYNEPASTLTRAIDSIRYQTDPDFEFIIIDDGSTAEETVELLDRFASAENRIKLIRSTHVGLTRCLNLAASAASGEYLVRQDSDDWSEPLRLQRFREYLQRNITVALLGSWWAAHDERGAFLWNVETSIKHEDLCRFLERGNPFCHGSVLISASAFRHIGGYRDLFKQSQDYDLFCRLTEQYHCGIIPEVLYHRRFTSYSVSSSRSQQQIDSSLLIQALAIQRRVQGEEDLALAREKVSLLQKKFDGDGAELKKYDLLMLAGHHQEAIAGFLKLTLSNFSFLAFSKFIRSLIYLALPPIRKKLFNIS